MKMMMTISIGAEDGNRALKDGSLAKIMEDFIREHKPESAYFGTLNGDRTAFYVFDLADATLIPSVAEPSFMGLNAKISMQPVMNIEDLRAGLQKAFG
jgi:hypothetical protein